MFSKYDPRACANCGELHICTGTAECPCFEFELPESVLDYIEAHFDECVCTECMNLLVAQNLAGNLG